MLISSHYVSSFIKSLTVFCLGTALAFPVAASGKDKDDKIRHAMSAAPERISGHAKIVDMDGTVLRDGNNGWVCMPGVALLPGSTDPMCNDSVWMAWIEANKKGEAFKTTTIGFSYMLIGDDFVHNDDPAATDPDKGGNWIAEGPHLMILLPDPALAAGLSNDPRYGPYVMWGNTPAWHLMVPTGPARKIKMARP